MHPFIKSLSKKDYCPFLLCIFFFFHGYVRYFPSIHFTDILLPLFLYLLGAATLFFLSFLILGSLKKACVLTVCIVAFNFFFGSIHDFLKSNFGNSLVVKYSFLLPATLLLFCAFIIYLKKSKKDPSSAVLYLNYLFIILIAIDLGSLTYKSISKNSIINPETSVEFRNCSTCSWPDVYFIIADAYPGQKELKDLFSFDNSAFENQLTQRGFHVLNHTTSNYNWTPYSLASTLNMEYLHLNTHTINYNDILACSHAIEKNTLIHFFEQNGYKIYNYSIFDLDKNSTPLQHVFATPRKALLSETFIERFRHDLGFNFLRQEHLEKLEKQITRKYLYNNNKADSLTRAITVQKPGEKKFVYTHLMFPHTPFFFDSIGKENPEPDLHESAYTDKQLFIGYLLYANKKLISLIDYIRTHSKQPPVIILMSDHGFKEFEKPVNEKYHFMNLSAVYFPNGNYFQSYEGLSNVNQFRLLLNSQFGQKLPLLKDSSFFLYEK
jgi:hypothetical protein